MSSADHVLRRTGDGFVHWCPACKCLHLIETVGPDAFEFDGDLNAPTFAPDVRVPGAVGPESFCHYHIEAGIIRFCGDCTHAMAGMSVDMSPVALDGGAS